MVCYISNLKHHAKLQKNVASRQMGRPFSWHGAEMCQIIFVIYDEIVKILALVLKNIEANFIFLARLFVTLRQKSTTNTNDITQIAMRKAYILILLTLLCSITTAWADFNPEVGRPFALQEKTSGLYLDILVGVDNPYDDGVQRNISLVSSPCEIYFEKFDWDAWAIKNVDGEYVCNEQAEGLTHNTKIGSTKKNWVFLEKDGYLIIETWGPFIYGEAKVGAPLFYGGNTENDKKTPMQFSLVDLANLTQEYTFYIDSNAPEGVSVTYDGNSVSEAQVFNGGFVVGLFVATDIEGYTWEIVVDDENHTITLVYTEVQEVPSRIDCPTVGTENNGKYYFTSERLSCPVPCNTLRFTLTESGAFFQNGAKRMSFDEFKLYNTAGEEVKLQTSYITGNNNKSYEGMLDGVNNVYAGTKTWNDGTEDDWFEITLPYGVDLGGAFSFSFVTENTTMNAKRFTIDLSYKKLDKEYTVVVDKPEGEEVSVTYNNVAIVGSTFIVIGAIDADLFDATEIPGYTWLVAIDEENCKVTITYVEAVKVNNPEAVVALIKRIGGEGAADKFKFILDPSINSKLETFILGSEDNKILIKGTTISAITTGIGWYLNNIAHINIAWNSLNEKTSNAAYVNLPADLPFPTSETHTTDAKYRYYLNYCTFGYSMTTWTWERWQKEIDWMALHGVNMPLQIIGLEEVWRKFLTMKDGQGNSKYNYSDEEAKAFVAGPAFTAWWGMNNLEGWGGTGADGWGGVQDDAWYVRQQELATKILTLQRALGMEPVLPGFSGMVPSNFTDKTKIATDDNGKVWNNFTRPHIVSPTSERFADIAKDYYTCLTAVMGTSQYYSMDPFHEGGSFNGSYSDAYAAIYNAMNTARPNAQWVIQQWQWWGGNQTASLTAVPVGKLIVLDLFSDGRPEFNYYGGYVPQHAVFCAIPNFGGRSGLMGRLENVTKNYFEFKGKYKSIKGVGTAPEAIEQTPITYDLVYQLPWMDSKPDVSEWVAKYAVSRYGQDNAIVKEAWDQLRQGPLNYGADGIQGPIEDVWAARPNLDGNPSSSWGTTLSTSINNEGETAGDIYTPERRQMLADAVYKLLSQEQALGLAEGSIYESNYLYDLVEFGSAVMADYAHDLLLGIGEARSAGDNVLYETRRDAFLQLILDMDDFKGTNLNFRLGKWTEEARAAAEEVEGWETKNTADWYEFNNARTLITTWGDRAQNGNGNWNDGLKDYSYRSWQGLLADYYYPRWAYYFDNGCTHPDSYFYFEWNWAHGMTHEVGQTAKSNVKLSANDPGYSYSRDPEGNTITLAQKLLSDYIIPVNADNGVYYAYRYLDNDMTNQVTVPAEAGSSIDLTEWFGAFTDVTITGDIIDGTATTLNSVAINTGATDGKHTVTITCSDGTAFLFSVMINPPYYGAYYIKYKHKDNGQLYPIFIDYNETTQADNDGKGYKLITPSESVRATAAADEIFTITPHAGGYSISAQGKYLQQPVFSSWNHLMFSDDKAEAGVYLFKETEIADLFKIYSPSDSEYDHNYVNSYGEIFGNDNSTTATSTFTLERATTYRLTIPTSGYTTLYLPFNVVLPEGLSAYDINTIENGKAVLIGIAAEGHILKKGTPVIIMGTEDKGYDLTITMSNANARSSIDNSLLRGTFVKQTVAAEGKYQLSGDMLTPMPNEGIEITNGCWVEWSGSAESIPFTFLDYIAVDGWKLKFEENANGLTLTEHTQEGISELVIPSIHIVNGEGKTITALSDGFLANTNITSIVLPETLEEMGNLSGCANLQSITFTSNPPFVAKSKVAESVECHLLLDDSKAVDFNTANANTFDYVTYRRRLPDGVYGSIILPFEPNTESLQNYSFFALSSSTSESLIFTEVASPKPNIPYIYTKMITGTSPDITASDISITFAGSPTTTKGSWVTVGCYENAIITVDNTAHYYGISSADNQFYHVTGSIKAKPYRAYFKNTDVSSSAAPKLILRLTNGDTTEIENVDVKCPSTIYDMLGRPVTNPNQGVYITKGKKIVIK